MEPSPELLQVARPAGRDKEVLGDLARGPPEAADVEASPELLQVTEPAGRDQEVQVELVCGPAEAADLRTRRTPAVAYYSQNSQLSYAYSSDSDFDTFASEDTPPTLAPEAARIMALDGPSEVTSIAESPRVPAPAGVASAALPEGLAASVSTPPLASSAAPAKGIEAVASLPPVSGSSSFAESGAFGVLSGMRGPGPSGGREPGIFPISRRRQPGEMVGLLGTFDTTPPSTCTTSLQWAMLHWNIPMSAKACCPWHNSLQVGARLIALRDATECAWTWKPLSGWQCRACASMNHDDCEACDICRRKRPADDCRSVASTPRTSSEPAAPLRMSL